MVYSTYRYIKDQARPRWRELLCRLDILASLGISLYVAFSDRMELFRSTPTSYFVDLVVTYASIAIGFSLTAAVFALSVPDRRVAVTIARLSLKKGSGSAYSDLIFTFTWSAFTHAVAILMLLVHVVCVGDDYRIVDGHADLSVTVPLIAIMFAVTYAATQFLVAIITVSVFGNVYIEFLRNSKTDDSGIRNEKED